MPSSPNARPTRQNRSYILNLAGPVVTLAILGAVACGTKSHISEVRMAYAPPLASDCSVEFVQADMTSPDFNQKWTVLGHIVFGADGVQDPMAHENLELARPRACAMGGTSLAIGVSAVNQTALGSGSTISYMVLKPK